MTEKKAPEGANFAQRKVFNVVVNPLEKRFLNAYIREEFLIIEYLTQTGRYVQSVYNKSAKLIIKHYYGQYCYTQRKPLDFIHTQHF